jgi:hypothetical protein
MGAAEQLSVNVGEPVETRATKREIPPGRLLESNLKLTQAKPLHCADGERSHDAAQSICNPFVVLPLLFVYFCAHPWPCMLLYVRCHADSIPSALTIFSITYQLSSN